MQNNSVKRWELINIDIPAGSTNTKFNFDREANLTSDSTQDIIITGIEVFPKEVVPATQFGNLPVATMAQLQNSFLVLYVGTEESVNLIPLPKLVNNFAALSTSVLQSQFEPVILENLQVQWEKSYIQAAAAYGSDTEFQFMFGVRYKKLPPGAWAQITAGAIPGL